MWTGMGTSLWMRIHVWTWTWTQTQCRNTTESILLFWTVNRKWNQAWIFPLYEWLRFWYLFHMSKVTPECMPPTRGDFGHGPFFLFERVIRYQEYTHGFVVPLWLLYHPRNWNFIFLFRLRTESLTTISITCFLCPSKEGTKSMHGNKICKKFIVIYNVDTLSYKNI